MFELVNRIRTRAADAKQFSSDEDTETVIVVGSLSERPNFQALDLTGHIYFYGVAVKDELSIACIAFLGEEHKAGEFTTSGATNQKFRKSSGAILAKTSSRN